MPINLGTPDIISDAKALEDEVLWLRARNEKLEALREAAQYVQETWQLDSDREVAEVPFGPACMLRDSLAACDEASAQEGAKCKR